MSQNRPGNENDFGSTTSNTGDTGTGTGQQGGGYSSGGGLSTTGGGAATGTATAPASGGIADRAKQYGQTVADAASQAKDYISDKASVVGDKLSGLRDVDYAEYANQAKDYARQNPGQALLVAAAAGFVIGLLVRGGRR
jgi:ElaB/YqjD/DUF883 family membrane-anchored ribosome-binding protein